MILYTIIEGHNSSAEGPECRGIYTTQEAAVDAVKIGSTWGLQGQPMGDDYYDGNAYTIADEADDFYWKIQPWGVQL